MKTSTQRLFCFGHRGARGHEPENTLRSVRKALELGADSIEVDVYFVDGQLVVIHDHTFGRTTNDRGFVARKSQTNELVRRHDDVILFPLSQ